jgi:hypothetical protein
MIRLVPDQLELAVYERFTAEALDAHEPEQTAQPQWIEQPPPEPEMTWNGR